MITSSFVCVAIFHCVSAQQCVKFEPASAPGAGGVCIPYLSERISLNSQHYIHQYTSNSIDNIKVWVPIVPNAMSLIDKAFNQSILWKIKAVKPIVAFRCYDTIVSLLCNAAFPPCNDSSGCMYQE